MTAPHSRERAVAALRQATGDLSAAARGRIESEMTWFGDLSAQDRSWVGVVVAAGVTSFVDWYADPALDTGDDTALAAALFGAAPRALTGVISLQQTVDLVRIGIDVVEANVARILDPADVADVHHAVLRYAREVAFATAEVYARAAEVRGAWDARLEALVVDAVLRSDADEQLLSRASALGWDASGHVVVVLGRAPTARAETDVFDQVRRAARAAGMDALCATQGDRLVVVLGGIEGHDDGAATKAATAVADAFGDGPVVVGPVAADLRSAHLSSRAAQPAFRAAVGWPEAPRPVGADELLPERVLAGDGHARRHLVEEVWVPLLAHDTLVDTLSAYFAENGSVEGTARRLFVHPNTVRYRLKQVAATTGLSPSDARAALTLRLALVLGRQSGREA